MKQEVTEEVGYLLKQSSGVIYEIGNFMIYKLGEFFFLRIRDMEKIEQI